MQNERLADWRGKSTAFWREYRRDKMGVVGLVIVATALVVALAAPIIAPYDPWDYSGGALAPPSVTNLFGTDTLGRDVFSRVVWGTRISLTFGVAAAGLAGVLGIVLGAVPTYYGGRVDDLFSRVFEFVLIIPMIFLLILVMALFSSNIYFMMVIVGLTMWPWLARIMRAQVLSLKSKAFVEASLVSGAGGLRILFKHIIPNGIQPVLANITLQVAFAILTEAGLSYLGVGDPNQVTWGQVLYWGQNSFRTAWWNAFFPGLAIVVLALGFTLVGDGISSTLNPRLRERA
jgi:peptide/nickel transport system permease protein